MRWHGQRVRGCQARGQLGQEQEAARKEDQQSGRKGNGEPWKVTREKTSEESNHGAHRHKHMEPILPQSLHV